MTSVDAHRNYPLKNMSHLMIELVANKKQENHATSQYFTA